jgi:hypothetical protein
MLIPPLKALNGTADHQVNNTVQYETHRSLIIVLRQKDNGTVKETISQKRLGNEYPSFARDLVLRIDAENIRIMAHIPVKIQIQINIF